MNTTQFTFRCILLFESENKVVLFFACSPPAGSVQGLVSIAASRHVQGWFVLLWSRHVCSSPPDLHKLQRELLLFQDSRVTEGTSLPQNQGESHLFHNQTGDRSVFSLRFNLCYW